MPKWHRYRGGAHVDSAVPPPGGTGYGEHRTRGGNVAYARGPHMCGALVMCGLLLVGCTEDESDGDTQGK
jgi:hypothetical protein